MYIQVGTLLSMFIFYIEYNDLYNHMGMPSQFFNFFFMLYCFINLRRQSTFVNCTL